jgi:hypothetical protein
MNAQIKRLNILSPHARFTRATLDADEALRPLFRASRATSRGDRSDG